MILDLFRKEVEFENIQGYDDLKDIVRRALDAEDNYNLLFIGPPASAKTLFLLGILKSKKGVYFDVMEANFIRIDELDKMPKQFQEKLLNFKDINKSDQSYKINGLVKNIIEPFFRLREDRQYIGRD